MSGGGVGGGGLSWQIEEGRGLVQVEEEIEGLIGKLVGAELWRLGCCGSYDPFVWLFVFERGIIPLRQLSQLSFVAQEPPTWRFDLLWGIVSVGARQVAVTNLFVEGTCSSTSCPKSQDESLCFIELTASPLCRPPASSQ